MKSLYNKKMFKNSNELTSGGTIENNVSIKKIIYNLFYGCYGRPFELNRTYVIFERNKITYCQEPLYKDHSYKNNCLIKISYDPTKDYDDYKSKEITLNDATKYNFENISKYVKNIFLNHKENYRVYDATPASIDIYDINGKKKSVDNLFPEEISFIDLIIEQYMPDSFKRATGFNDEYEDEE